MDIKRYKQISALNITRTEMEEFFKMQKKERTLQKEQIFPLKIIYNDNSCTDKILCDKRALGMKIDGKIFLLCIILRPWPEITVIRDFEISIGGIYYTAQLPSIKDIKSLRNNLEKINKTIIIANRVYDQKDKPLRGNIWGKSEPDAKGKSDIVAFSLTSGQNAMFNAGSILPAIYILKEKHG